MVADKGKTQHNCPMPLIWGKKQHIWKRCALSKTAQWRACNVTFIDFYYYILCQFLLQNFLVLNQLCFAFSVSALFTITDVFSSCVCFLGLHHVHLFTSFIPVFVNLHCFHTCSQLTNFQRFTINYIKACVMWQKGSNISPR